MPERALQQTLQELHQRLSSEEALDAELRDELRRTMEEIGRRLEDEKGDGLDAPLLERVRELVLRFESEHPTVAEAVERVTNALSRLGI